MDALKLRPGDILACYGTDGASRLVSAWTSSIRRPAELRLGPSHVAICVDHPGRGLILVESTTLCDHECLFRGEAVSGVQAHYPEERINDYHAAGGHVDCWRINDYWRLSSREELFLWEVVAKHFEDDQIAYDLRGAITSGTRLLCKIVSFLETDLERLFCSELIAAALMRLNRMPIANATRYNPARLLRQLARSNVYQYSGPVEVNFSIVRED